ncbi:MAG: tetratricopeptide repeat protein [Nitrospinae bacterium]|nr:tetratricopeptide repeat protein [Nitrospinota bacterium]
MSRAEKRYQQKIAKKFGGGAINLQQALESAVSHHVAGQFQKAERIYRKILRVDPNQADALHLLGVTAHQKGNDKLAVDLISKSLAINPGFADAHNNLGDALQELGELDNAVSSYRKAITIEQNHALAHSNLGTVLHELGKLDEAVEAYQKAIEINSDYAEAYFNLGLVQNEQNKTDRAVTSFQKAIALKPGLTDAYIHLANTLKKSGRGESAIAILRQAVAFEPKSAEACNVLGITHREQGNLSEAIVSYQKALSINPEFAEVHNNLGNAQKELGNMDEAGACYQKAIEIDPNYSEPYMHIAIMKRHTVYDDDLKNMEEAYNKAGIRDEQKMHLAFGLGKAFEDLEQYEKAFTFYEVGNDLKRKDYNFSDAAHCHFIKKTKETFNEALFTRNQDGGSANETPVFILGMPRSGTTLVEQILASHPQVHGAGELEKFSQMVLSLVRKKGGGDYPDCMNLLNRTDLKSLGDEYVVELRKLSSKARLISDKMPENYLYVGLIKLALPKARVIHCRRDPADNCLSIYKTYFSAKGHYYAYNQVEIGKQYNHYLDLMAHWEKVLPGFMHEVQYEKMIADTTGQTRALLEFCDLEWYDSCLEFHKSKRPVKTASSEQVRRPIYKSSVRAWKRYEKQLAPLIATLEHS